MPITVHRNETLTKLAMRAEEHVFINCKLIECHIFYEGGPFHWEQTDFSNCSWSFRGAAKATTDLLQKIGLMKVQGEPQTNVRDSTSVN